MAEVKRFGAHERPAVKEFELQTLTDDGSERVHRFQLVPIVPAGHVTALMDALDDEPEKSFGLMAKLLARLLDNTDGVPAKWSAVEFEDPAPGDKGYDPANSQRFFTGPDGEVYPVDAIERTKWENVDNGSSRRRWNWLMNPDNEDEAVHLSDLADIAKWVIAEAVDRPTPARPSSTRGSRKNRR